ncbi:MAG: Predicted cobalt transporter CbtA, partial [uncultured Acidimicrobiales bacterium]
AGPVRPGAAAVGDRRCPDGRSPGRAGQRRAADRRRRAAGARGHRPRGRPRRRARFARARAGAPVGAERGRPLRGNGCLGRRLRAPLRPRLLGPPQRPDPSVPAVAVGGSDPVRLDLVGPVAQVPTQPAGRGRPRDPRSASGPLRVPDRPEPGSRRRLRRAGRAAAEPGVARAPAGGRDGCDRGARRRDRSRRAAPGSRPGRRAGHPHLALPPGLPQRQRPGVGRSQRRVRLGGRRGGCACRRAERATGL